MQSNALATDWFQKMTPGQINPPGSRGSAWNTRYGERSEEKESRRDPPNGNFPATSHRATLYCMTLAPIDRERIACPRCGIEKPSQFRWAVCLCAASDEMRLPDLHPRQPLALLPKRVTVLGCGLPFGDDLK